ncbi:hypothetical protein PaG_00503 [Moesziomyces aphidis]|uniref:Uncharacterized protein n=1 Tax=Moesziomyces aphidis TaxID=84754 RepID=W3VU64_MOEAP|nr:hypothetical protein PaG_00503 [Moesziomyces aphidis]
MSEWSHSLGYSAADIFPDTDSEGEGEGGSTTVADGPVSAKTVADDEEKVDFIETPFTIAARNALFRKARQGAFPARETATPKSTDDKGKSRALDAVGEYHSPASELTPLSEAQAPPHRFSCHQEPIEVIVVSSDSESEEELTSGSGARHAGANDAEPERSGAEHGSEVELGSESILDQLFEENHEFYDRLGREVIPRGRATSPGCSSAQMDTLMTDGSTTYDTSSWAPTEPAYYHTPSGYPACDPVPLHYPSPHTSEGNADQYAPVRWQQPHVQTTDHHNGYGCMEPQTIGCYYEPHVHNHRYDHPPMAGQTPWQPEIQEDTEKADSTDSNRASSSRHEEGEEWSTLRATRTRPDGTLSLTAAMRRPIPPTRLAPSSRGGSRLALPLYRTVGSSAEERRRAENLLDRPPSIVQTGRKREEPVVSPVAVAPRTKRLFQPAPLPPSTSSRTVTERDRR